MTAETYIHCTPYTALKYSEISGFLYDARRFVVKNRQIVGSAPLQLYSSVLIFAPNNSIIKRQFNGNLAASGQLPQVKENWSAEIQTLEGHSNWVSFVAFSPNNQLLASSSSDKTIKLWNPTTGELRKTLHGHSNLVLSQRCRWLVGPFTLIACLGICDTSYH